MANEWRNSEPKTTSKILKFYSKTELYFWEQIQWHNTSNYDSRLVVTDYLIDNYSPLTHHCVLDYGCGVGAITLRFTQEGDSVTIADVSGKTLDFAKHRFQRTDLHLDDIPGLKLIEDFSTERKNYQYIILEIDETSLVKKKRFVI